MEMGWIVLVEIHADDDPEKTTNLGHPSRPKDPGTQPLPGVSPIIEDCLSSFDSPFSLGQNVGMPGRFRDGFGMGQVVRGTHALNGQDR
jgi:hypothetical protein